MRHERPAIRRSVDANRLRPGTRCLLAQFSRNGKGSRRIRLDRSAHRRRGHHLGRHVPPALGCQHRCRADHKIEPEPKDEGPINRAAQAAIERRSGRAPSGLSGDTTQQQEPL